MTVKNTGEIAIAGGWHIWVGLYTTDKRLIHDAKTSRFHIDDTHFGYGYGALPMGSERRFEMVFDYVPPTGVAFLAFEILDKDGNRIQCERCGNWRVQRQRPRLSMSAPSIDFTGFTSSSMIIDASVRNAGNVNIPEGWYLRVKVYTTGNSLLKEHPYPRMRTLAAGSEVGIFTIVDGVTSSDAGSVVFEFYDRETNRIACDSCDWRIQGTGLSRALESTRISPVPSQLR